MHLLNFFHPLLFASYHIFISHLPLAAAMLLALDQVLTIDPRCSRQLCVCGQHPPAPPFAAAAIFDASVTAFCRYTDSELLLNTVNSWMKTWVRVFAFFFNRRVVSFSECRWLMDGRQVTVSE